MTIENEQAAAWKTPGVPLIAKEAGVPEIDKDVLQIVRHHAAKIIGRAGLTWDDLPDVEQDMLLVIARKLPQYTEAKGKWTTWVFTQAKWGARNVLNKRLRNLPPFQLIPNYGEAPTTKTPDSDLQMDVDAAIERMPKRLSVIARLLMRGNSQAEIGDMMGLCRERVRQLIVEMKPHMQEIENVIHRKRTDSGTGRRVSSCRRRASQQPSAD